MSIRDDLRRLYEAEAPFIDQALDLAEHFAEVRKAAADKGIDWSRAKVLFKALRQDERDGGKRAAKLEGNADLLTEYAEHMRGATMVNNKNFSSAVSAAAPVGERPSIDLSADDLSIPPFLRRQPAISAE